MSGHTTPDAAPGRPRYFAVPSDVRERTRVPVPFSDEQAAFRPLYTAVIETAKLRCGRTARGTRECGLGRRAQRCCQSVEDGPHGPCPCAQPQPAQRLPTVFPHIPAPDRAPQFDALDHALAAADALQAAHRAETVLDRHMRTLDRQAGWPARPVQSGLDVPCLGDLLTEGTRIGSVLIRTSPRRSIG